MSGKKVRKVVIPAAGYGTRFLPVTKASPKEMLPIVDKPVIQYVVEEAVAAGIEEIIFITSSNKRALEDHFDYNFELEEQLKRSGKNELYKQIRAISDMARFVYIRQKEMRGNGDAILIARNLIGDEPFLVLWGDEIVAADPARATQLVRCFEEKQTPIITVIKTDDPEDTKQYGYIESDGGNGLYRVKGVIEKPGPDKAPSNLAIIGGYVLTPEIFPILENLPLSVTGELWLADAINELARTHEMYATELTGATYYDSGSKFGFIKANIDFGLQHPETRQPLLEYLKSLRDA